MKIAVSGKGGVGKTTLVAAMSKLFALDGAKVISIDADPDMNLAAALGFGNAEKITPLVELKDLIRERTGSTSEEFGKLFKLNPTVSDLPEKYSIVINGVRLMTLGTIKRGGGGCACPEGVMLKTLLNHLILQRDEVVIIDMEAGIEHLGRASIGAVTALIVVVEPGKRSVQTAFQVKKLADDIGVKTVLAVGSKVMNEEHKSFLRDALQGIPLLGFISYNEKLIESDLRGEAIFTANEKLLSDVREIIRELKKYT
ncbi:MAG: carbon monoxide dehydrogenase [Candidatus Scalindua sp. AMX11]|nr:MAG: carbon monoxide dehydrogenase [Candidatus Scalindua sp.]NOG85734.1 AAA family ATPase [Planctomycetota bacterium]RZV73182.1 MAG: carbon monoxide dehydrogenase [Candidatus Scalindua sp. SCAELEC01]TDE64728.1 MAG: carbon monoxide dehydrogenase [Candidatus Scalindua sp. AMX11]GJQ58708.1 MAG: carbon monoxide dehydrogenase [Candidatus Scalindua sp.]